VSLGKRATRGAIWNVGGSTATRAIGLIGTLYMTRLLRPDEIGEVASAAVIAQTANWVSNWGFNQYMIVHGAKGDEQTYHAAVVNLVFGLVGLCAIAGTGTWFAPVFHAPGFRGVVRSTREQVARNIFCLICLDIMRAPSAGGST
jgi:O-antigen/teichoic acid export membrane protein